VRLLAALCFGVCGALLAGALVGVPLRWRAWRPRTRGGRESWSERLARSGARVTVLQFVAGSVAAGLVTIALVDALTGSVFVGIVPAIGIAAMPAAYFSHRRARLEHDVQAAWPDALSDLLASIAAGRSLTQACHELGEHGPLPLREAFGQVSRRARMTGLGAALETAKADLGDPVSDRILEVMLLAEETGGAVVRIVLSDLVTSITKDLEVAEQIETDGLEMRINARSVVALPWVVLVALTAGHGPFRDFYQSGAGIVTIAVGLVLSGFGFLLVNRLARTPPEPRVLGGSAS
jgi:tight adherence protein B